MDQLIKETAKETIYFHKLMFENSEKKITMISVTQEKLLHSEPSCRGSISKKLLNKCLGCES